jgi:hypothetical protein
MRRLSKLLLFILAFGCFASSQTIPQSTVLRMFWHPMMKGERLDYCNEDLTKCGRQIASCYCKKMGYDYAKRFVKAPNLGLTRFVSEKNECRGWKCSGFDFIECQGERKYLSRPSSDYQQKLFVRPRWHHFPVSWCYKNSKQCGAQSAYAFCRYQGYGKVVQYSKQKSVPASKEMATSALCINQNCKGFEYILCERI